MPPIANPINCVDWGPGGKALLQLAQGGAFTMTSIHESAHSAPISSLPSRQKQTPTDEVEVLVKVHLLNSDDLGLRVCRTGHACASSH